MEVIEPRPPVSVSLSNPPVSVSSPLPADQGVIAAAAVEYVVAALAIEGIVVGIARKRIGKLRAANLRDTGEGVCSDRGITGRRPRREIDGHTTGGADEGDAGIAVAGDGVVAAQSLELVERAAVADIQRAGLPNPVAS